MRIFAASFGAPHYWGGSTALYHFAPALATEGFVVRHAVLATRAEIERRDVGWHDPENRGSLLIDVDSRGALARALRAFAPDLTMSKDARGVYELRRAQSRGPVVYLLSTSEAAHAYGRAGVEAGNLLQQIEGGRIKRDVFAESPQHEAVRLADRVIPHSAQTDTLLRHFVPEYASKAERVHWTCFFRDAENVAVPIARRGVDILMASAAWGDPVKNAPLAEKIARRLVGDFDVEIVGNFPTRLRGVRHPGHLTHEGLQARLRDARLVVIPSFYDAGPNLVAEAVRAGCDVLISRNCGNATFFADRQLPALDDIGAIVAAIRRRLRRPNAPPLPFAPGEVRRGLSRTLRRIARA